MNTKLSPDLVANRDDGILLWRFTTGDGTVDVEATDETDATAKFDAVLNPAAEPAKVDVAAAVNALATLDPKTTTVADVIGTIRKALNVSLI